MARLVIKPYNINNVATAGDVSNVNNGELFIDKASKNVYYKDYTTGAVNRAMNVDGTFNSISTTNAVSANVLSSNFGYFGRMQIIHSSSAPYMATHPEGRNVLAFNIEQISGLNTTGFIIVQGAENNVNRSISMYSYNLSCYWNADGSLSRYCRLKRMELNNVGNSHGTLYLYLDNYDDPATEVYRSADQFNQSQNASCSNIRVDTLARQLGYVAGFTVLKFV